VSEGHARLGPSNARWPNCPGSVREEERYPDVSGEAAIDGTGSHLLLELCLQNNVPAAQYDQQIIGANHPDNMNGWMVAPDRIKRVQMALDYITRRVVELKEQFPGCTVSVESEQKSDPGGAFGRDDWWGTVDITITARQPMTGEAYFIEVADYKDGRGYVSEKRNTQLTSYLFGKMRPYICSGNELVRPFHPNKVGGCRMTIIQPKTNPVVRYQCSTRPEDEFTPWGVVDAAIELSQAAVKTDEDNAPVASGKHCQWCKANPKRGGHCNAETAKSMEVVESMNTEMTPVKIEGDAGDQLMSLMFNAVADPKSLTVEQLSQLADAKDGIMSVFDKVNAEIQERIEQGTSVPGYDMQPGNSSQVYNESEEVVAKKLKACRMKKDDIFPAKLITPAALMKSENLTTGQKERLKKELITVKGGKLSLKKVAHDHVSEKLVAQSTTDGLPSTEAELMFAGVPKIESAVSTVESEVSFF